MNHLRHLPRLGHEIAAYVLRSGRWWTPVLILLLALAIGAAATASSVVPVSVYVLF